MNKEELQTAIKSGDYLVVRDIASINNKLKPLGYKLENKELIDIHFNDSLIPIYNIMGKKPYQSGRIDINPLDDKEPVRLSFGTCPIQILNILVPYMNNLAKSVAKVSKENQRNHNIVISGY